MDTDPVKVIDVLSQERDDEHLARSRAEDERDHLRAEVERLRAELAEDSDEAQQAHLDAFHAAEQRNAARSEAERLRVLAGRQHEALNAVWDCYCSDRVATQPDTVDAVVFACLANPDSQRAGEEYAALVAVAKEAETEPVMSDNLRAKLAHLRAVRGGEGTEEYRGNGAIVR